MVCDDAAPAISIRVQQFRNTITVAVTRALINIRNVVIVDAVTDTVYLCIGRNVHTVRGAVHRENPSLSDR